MPTKAYIPYTVVEFGHMSKMVELLEKAKTKREHKALLTDISRFMKSMSRLSKAWEVPADFRILSISKVLQVEFPSNSEYIIGISYSNGEEQK